MTPSKVLCCGQELRNMAMQTEEKTNKPSLWNQALKVVKGDSTTELVEQFTQEMTLERTQVVFDGDHL